MNSGKLLIVRSADTFSTFIETMPDKVVDQNASLKMNDADVALLIEMLKQYHNGEISIINLTINHE